MALQQKPGEQTWTLTIYLEKFPAPEIEAAARDAAELLPTGLAVLLRFRVLMNANAVSEVERTFQEVTSEDGGIRAVLNLASIGEMNQIYQALTENASGPPHRTQDDQGGRRHRTADGPCFRHRLIRDQAFCVAPGPSTSTAGLGGNPRRRVVGAVHLRRSTPCSPEATPRSSISARWTLMP